MQMCNEYKLKQNKRSKSAFLFTLIGAILIFGAIALFGGNLWRNYQVQNNTQNLLLEVKERMPQNTISATKGLQSVTTFPGFMPAVNVEGYDFIGILNVPSQNIELPIANEWNDEISQVAPGRFVGSLQDKSLIIGGRNYKSHFGFLDNLADGDEITIVDVEGYKYHFTVVTAQTLDADDTNGLINPPDNWDLTLFTETFSGKDLLVIRCLGKSVS